MPMPKDFVEAASSYLCGLKKRNTSASSKSWIGRERSISTKRKQAGAGKAGLAIRVKGGGGLGPSRNRFPDRFKRESPSENVASPRRATATAGTEEVVPVYEEQLRVGKRDVSHGRVRIRSYVVETPVNEQVRLR